MKKLFGLSRRTSYIVFAIILLGIGFYWFQVRPALIKHECSWVQMHSSAVPERPAMTKEQLITKGIIRSCNAEIINLSNEIEANNTDVINTIKQNYGGRIPKFELGNDQIRPTMVFHPYDGIIHPMFSDALWDATSCISDGNKIIDEYSTTKNAIPAKNWYQSATKSQYEFCLHDRGL